MSSKILKDMRVRKTRVGITLTDEEQQMLRAMIPIFSNDRKEVSQTAGRVIRAAYGMLVTNRRLKSEFQPGEYKIQAEMLRPVSWPKRLDGEEEAPEGDERDDEPEA